MPIALRRPFQRGPLNLDPVPRGTWGPIFGDPGIPPLFGPIHSPARERPERGPRFGPISGVPAPTTRRTRMPFDIGPNLTGLAGATLGAIFGRRQTAGRFMPGQTQTSVGFPGTGIPTTTFPERGMLGQVTRQGCDCLIEKQMPAYIRRMKGRAVFAADGSFAGCTPKAKRMNPLNGRAATRAARRLTSVMRFQKKIQKAVRRACGGRGGGGGFGRSPASKMAKCK